MIEAGRDVAGRWVPGVPPPTATVGQIMFLPDRTPATHLPAPVVPYTEDDIFDWEDWVGGVVVRSRSAPTHAVGVPPTVPTVLRVMRGMWTHFSADRMRWMPPVNWQYTPVLVAPPAAAATTTAVGAATATVDPDDDWVAEGGAAPQEEEVFLPEF